MIHPNDDKFYHWIQQQANLLDLWQEEFVARNGNLETVFMIEVHKNWLRDTAEKLATQTSNSSPVPA